VKYISHGQIQIDTADWSVRIKYSPYSAILFAVKMTSKQLHMDAKERLGNDVWKM